MQRRFVPIVVLTGMALSACNHYGRSTSWMSDAEVRDVVKQHFIEFQDAKDRLLAEPNDKILIAWQNSTPTLLENGDRPIDKTTIAACDRLMRITNVDSIRKAGQDRVVFGLQGMDTKTVHEQYALVFDKHGFEQKDYKVDDDLGKNRSTVEQQIDKTWGLTHTKSTK